MKKFKKKIVKKELNYNDISKDIVSIDHYKEDMSVVLYGKAGTGKTTLAATFPKPILFIDCSEKGTGSIRDAGKDVQQIRLRSWEQVDQLYWYLKKKKLYKTVVIDTVSGMQTFCIKSVMEAAGKKINLQKLGHWGTMSQKDWGQVSTLMTSTIINFRDIEGLEKVYIAHEKEFFQQEGQESNGIDPAVGPNVIQSVEKIMNACVNVIGNTYIRKHKRKIKDGKKILEKKEIQYCLRIGPNEVYRTKIRKPKKFLLPDVIVNPSYSKIDNIINGRKE